jgi:hypothetical protein
MICHSASTVNRSSHPPGRAPFWIFPGGDYFCLWYLLSDESWRIALTQKTMEMAFCIVFYGHAMIRHQNVVMFLATGPPQLWEAFTPWTSDILNIFRGWMPLISYRLGPWQQHFNGNAKIMGKTKKSIFCMPLFCGSTLQLMAYPCRDDFIHVGDWLLTEIHHLQRAIIL